MGQEPAASSGLDAAVANVSASASRWASLSAGDRVALLDRLLSDCGELAPEWLETSARGKGVLDNPDAVGQEWVSGPYVTLRYMRRLRDTLHQLEAGRTVRIPKVYRRQADGRAIARVLPRDAYDRLFFSGVSAEVVMAEGISPQEVGAHVALAYAGEPPAAGTTLVLSAGNVSGMGPIDGLCELFLGNHTVVLKASPVNGYMSEIIGRGLRALIEEGFLRIVQGGSDEAAYLCDHPGIDAIRLTGSNRTYETVVYGCDGLESQRKARGERLRTKPVAAELGGVGPAIVVPGTWTRREIVQGATLVATMAFDGGGFSCGATDVLVLHDAWPQKDDFVDALRAVLSSMPLRPAYYPGARERYETFVAGHERVELFGTPAEEKLPWAYIRHLDPRDRSEICFSHEPFCAVFADTELSAPDIGTYIDAAVRFANERVWGTLAATLLVPASVSRNDGLAARVERAIADLKYGTVAVNYHPSACWVSGSTPWGGYQGAGVDSSESGVGFSQNAMMLSDTEKTVIRAPSGGPFPPPVWLAGRGEAACATFAKLCAFEARPSLTQVPGIAKSGLGR